MRHTTSTLAPWLVLTAVSGCAGGGPEPPGPAPGETAADCIHIEVQNTSLTGVTIWIQWANRSPQRMGRLSVSARRVYELRFRNNEVLVQFQADGGAGRISSNPMLATPGDRLDIVYRNTGPGPLRRTGVARCS